MEENAEKLLQLIKVFFGIVKFTLRRQVKTLKEIYWLPVSVLILQQYVAALLKQGRTKKPIKKQLLMPAMKKTFSLSLIHI